MSWGKKKNGVNSEFVRQVNQIVRPCLAAPWSHLALLIHAVPGGVGTGGPGGAPGSSGNVPSHARPAGWLQSGACPALRHVHMRTRASIVCSSARFLGSPRRWPPSQAAGQPRQVPVLTGLILQVGRGSQPGHQILQSDRPPGLQEVHGAALFPGGA